LHELLGELVGVERRKRVLVLKLRGEQCQEGIEAMVPRPVELAVAAVVDGVVVAKPGSSARSSD